MKLSVIIVSYNVETFLAQCLVSVERAVEQVGTNDVEVFVVDNISVDGTCDMVEQRFPNVKLIRNTENVGFAVANNIAIVEAVGEYILLLNPDTVVSEDTFKKCIEFADLNPALGGMGVPMYDGSGVYLPESKRGLPTPWASLSRISGLFRLAPSSSVLNSYYAGHRSRDENAQIEVLSGAFMWMRKTTLDSVGLLDEAFFMYGEDIDLSWRIIKGGWENHYFAETKIIHYKGESTKKGSLNYVTVFYKAMLIFAAKHFEGGQARVFNLLIRIAIYARAGLSIMKRAVANLWVPILELMALFAALVGVTYLYSDYSGITYDFAQTLKIQASYSVFSVFMLWVFGGYDKPWIPRRVMKGIGVGAIVLLALYGLLPESLRFSRAIILLGAVSFASIVTVGRIVLGGWRLGKPSVNRLVVGNKEETKAILQLLDKVDPQDEDSECITCIMAPSELNSIVDYVRVHRIGEVVFSGRDVTASEIISALSSLSGKILHCRIAWSDDGSLVGAGGPSPDPVTELDRAIYGASAKRSKRLFDIISSLCLIIFSPLLLISLRFRWVLNAFHVLFGSKTWVGIDIPGTKSGAFTRPYILKAFDSKDIRVSERLSLSYARYYHWFEDLKLVLNSLLLQNEN